MYFYLIKILSDNNSQIDCILSVFLLTSIVHVCYLIIYFYVPPVWQFFQTYAQFLSRHVATLFGKKVFFGATTLGVNTTILFMIFFVIYYFHLNCKSKLELAMGLILLLIAQVFSIPVQLLVVDIMRQLNYSALISPMDFIAIPFLFGLIPIFILTYKKEIGTGTKKQANLKFLIIGLIYVFISVVLVTFPSLNFNKEKTPSNIFIYSKGVVNWNRPEFGNYGLRSSGMFGMLPAYLKSFEYTVIKHSTVNKDNLEKANVLVVINLDESFTKKEKNEIQQFVKRGGSLLVLGDHTGLGGMREPLNDLLKFTGVEFNFDSAHYLKQDWGDSYEFFPHPVTHKLKSNREIGISVGASLAISSNKAEPVITAKFGFSDLGNALNKNNAYLGDRRYNDGELLGDIILVAQAKYGKGKVLVFGDTSSFQNGVFLKNYKFIKNTFNWLVNEQVVMPRIIKNIVAVILMIVCTVLLFYFSKSNLADLKIFYLFATIFIALISTNLLDRKNIITSVPKGNIAYIDGSHLERFEKYGDEGIWSLSFNLMRNGYLPFINRDFSEERLKNSKQFLVIAPAENFKHQEIEVIDDYLKNGGIVIWSVGYEEKQASQKFLTKYGLDLDNLPLGNVPKNETDKKIRFVEAWPVLFENEKNIQVICEAWNFPVVVSKNIGQGKLILIADSHFLLSRNLEQDNSYYEENILFLKSLLTKK